MAPSRDQTALACPPHADAQCIQDIMIHAWASSTREAFGSGILVFHVYYDSKAIEDTLRAPASTKLISAFISDLAVIVSSVATGGITYAIRQGFNALHFPIDSHFHLLWHDGMYCHVILASPPSVLDATGSTYHDFPNSLIMQWQLLLLLTPVIISSVATGGISYAIGQAFNTLRFPIDSQPTPVQDVEGKSTRRDHVHKYAGQSLPQDHNLQWINV
ncbi:uncharacterized protein EDB91DRAFT_1252900 [Suillus paluster]|uniref:uncharacterized protein n=1 Tax=Suillus paluster TaxID=48578 RepID=UPI001B86A1CB|nr:uncharacterized protein EDB91DRAFT_1252900 [Suillus paluster]KAG1729858.1 hypothetical protein EDB91DRAFT_1252900 [Suillus paluster]